MSYGGFPGYGQQLGFDQGYGQQPGFDQGYGQQQFGVGYQVPQQQVGYQVGYPVQGQQVIYQVIEEPPRAVRTRSTRSTRSSKPSRSRREKPSQSTSTVRLQEYVSQIPPSYSPEPIVEQPRRSFSLPRRSDVEQPQQQSSNESKIEAQILASREPIEINESEEITVLGQRGIWANKSEVVNWKGVIPISEYQINEDKNPEVVNKKVSKQLEYIQELAVRYLRPPSPPPPGEILIKEEPNQLTPPAPPVVIRQQPPRPNTPEPLVIREAPPQPPKPVGRQVITISGRRIAPPPRKAVIERLAPLPAKPQSVLIERWLPYSEVKRRVVYQKAQQVNAQVVKPRNVIVQWEAPTVVVRKEIKYLGVVRANPVEYVQRYSRELKQARDLPQYVLDIKTPDGLVLAADHRYNDLYELEGDVQALRLVDLDKEGLSQYRDFVNKFQA